MGTFLAIVLFGLGLFLIIQGGDVLVRAALRLNEKTGINQVIIGATFVSVATTLPEVFVSMFAVAAGNHGIAVGNAIGSMIANIALVFAISLIFFPSGVRRGEIFFKALFLFAITAVVFLFGVNLQFSWYEGVILLSVFIGFLLFNIYESKKEKVAIPPIAEEKSGVAWGKIAFGFVLGQTMLCIGAFALVENGEILAHIFGISETVIGFTVIAVGTSLPELVTAVSSIRRKSGGLAVGNVIGANIINCTLLLGVCGIIGDIRGSGLPVSRETAFIALPVLFLMTVVAVLPILIKGRAYKGQGAVLLALYVAYIAYLFIVQPL